MLSGLKMLYILKNSLNGHAAIISLDHVTGMQAARPDKATALAELGETLLLLLERVSDGDVNGLVSLSHGPQAGSQFGKKAMCG